jgi:hypothetical protein
LRHSLSACTTCTVPARNLRPVLLERVNLISSPVTALPLGSYKKFAPTRSPRRSRWRRGSDSTYLLTMPTVVTGLPSVRNSDTTHMHHETESAGPETATTLPSSRFAPAEDSKSQGSPMLAINGLPTKLSMWLDMQDLDVDRSPVAHPYPTPAPEARTASGTSSLSCRRQHLTIASSLSPCALLDPRTSFGKLQRLPRGVRGASMSQGVDPRTERSASSIHAR